MLIDWRFDRYVRYRPIVEYLRKVPRESVLEVGSGTNGVTEFLPRKITAIDVDFGRDKTLKNPFIERVKNSGTTLPFKDKSYDITLSLDTLEHIPQNRRFDFISELVRVARKSVILGFPAGIEATKADKKLAIDHIKVFHRPHWSLDEHIKLGLPKINAVKRMISEAASHNRRTIENIRMINNYNMNIWLKINKFLLHPNLKIFILKNKLMAALVPFYKFLHNKPTYRRILFLEIN